MARTPEEEYLFWSSHYAEKTKASLAVQPGGDDERSDEDILNTEFDELFVGGCAELGEMKHFHQVTQSFQQEQELGEMAASVDAAIYYYTKNMVTYILIVLAGPILSVCWGIIVAVIKFSVSWVCYPAIKVLWIVAKPCRTLVKVVLLPAEPAFELVARMCPQVHFSLFAVKEDAACPAKKSSNHETTDRSGSKRAGTARRSRHDSYNREQSMGSNHFNV
jgi:hypothetical protein